MTDFLTEMREILAREIKSLSIDSGDAEKVINNITQSIKKQYGGQPVYVTKKSNDLNARNREIYKRSNGKNTRQLCRDYDLCAQQIRRIIESQRQLNQRDIFRH